MKRRHLLWITSIMAVLVCGCKTPPEPLPKTIEKEVPDTRIPLTRSIVERLRNSNQNISSVQLILSGGITLEGGNTTPSISVIGGKVKFEDVHTRDVIVIPDQLEGVASGQNYIGTEIILDVCFDENSKNTLPFSCKNVDADERFYFRINPDGTVNYGGRKYTVRYSRDPPILFIKVLQTSRVNSNNRTLLGNKVN